MDTILCKKEKRVFINGCAFSYKGKYFQIMKGGKEASIEAPCQGRPKPLVLLQAPWMLKFIEVTFSLNKNHAFTVIFSKIIDRLPALFFVVGLHQVALKSFCSIGRYNFVIVEYVEYKE